MYLPSHFEESRPDEIRRLVERQPLGLLVTTGAQGPIANSVPFLLDPGGAGGPGVLRAHVARANPVWRETVAGMALTLARPLALVILGLVVLVIGTFVAQAVAPAFVNVTAETAKGGASALYLTAYYVGGTLGAAQPVAWKARPGRAAPSVPPT